MSGKLTYNFLGIAASSTNRERVPIRADVWTYDTTGNFLHCIGRSAEILVRLGSGRSNNEQLSNGGEGWWNPYPSPTRDSHTWCRALRVKYCAVNSCWILSAPVTEE